MLEMIAGPRRIHSMGFTLVEIAVVLVIIAFLTGGALMAMRVQAQRSAFATTQAAMEEARDALLGFAVGNNGRLPCPAIDATGISITPCTAGVARRGVLPWRTLGVAGLDAWGQYLSYEVTEEYTTTPIAEPSTTSAQETSVAICTVRNGGRAADRNSVAFAIWSHGANGHEAFNVQGVRQPQSTDGDERSNAPTNPPVALQVVSHPHSDTYDDQVLWVSKFLWIKRLLDADIRVPAANLGNGPECPR